MTDSENAPTHSTADAIYAGVDVGGTTIKLGLVDGTGQILARDKLPTPSREHPDGAVASIATVLATQLKQLGKSFQDVSAIGVGSPGPINVERGLVLNPSNLPGWRNYPLRDRLQQACGGRPVTFLNDANAAAFGEFWAGVGRDAKSLVLLTLGTGVGGGVIVDDRIIAGHHDHGSELGHVCIDRSPTARRCGCGVQGHLEAYASATAVVARTREAIDAGQPSSLAALRDAGKPLSGLLICEHANAGDQLALKIIEETAHYLGWAIADLAHVIDPQIFVIGGAMTFGGPGSPLGQQFLTWMRDAAAPLTFPTIAQNLQIVFASLRGSAGIVGAAGWARQATLADIRN